MTLYKRIALFIREKAYGTAGDHNKPSADIQIRTGDLPLTKRVLYPTELCQLCAAIVKLRNSRHTYTNPKLGAQPYSPV